MSLNSASNELKKVENQIPIKENSYNKILKRFVQDWNRNEIDQREAMNQTLVRRVTSYVKTDNFGSVEIKYIAVKKLESEWKEIRKCEL